MDHAARIPNSESPDPEPSMIVSQEKKLDALTAAH